MPMALLVLSIRVPRRQRVAQRGRHPGPRGRPSCFPSAQPLCLRPGSPNPPAFLLTSRELPSPWLSLTEGLFPPVCTCVLLASLAWGHRQQPPPAHGQLHAPQAPHWAGATSAPLKEGSPYHSPAQGSLGQGLGQVQRESLLLQAERVGAIHAPVETNRRLARPVAGGRWVRLPE